jgi:hypothetical protein
VFGSRGSGIGNELAWLYDGAPPLPTKLAPAVKETR